MRDRVSEVLPSSFRDPSGLLYLKGGVLYRQVNVGYREEYDLLLSSGLYPELVAKGLLIAHEEVSSQFAIEGNPYKVLKPEKVEFISYPYEWSFSQLKDAALATLRIQKRALAHGMSLKDASAYNIQFHSCRPTLIDTLSFSRYQEGEPWVAYRQFCQHFLAPLALMALRDIRLGRMLREYIDGLPLDLTSRLLPWRTRINPTLALHIHAHAASQHRFADESRDTPMARHRMGKTAFLGLIDSLESAVNGLQWAPKGTDWADYAAMAHYSPEAAESKKTLVGAFLDEVNPSVVWDLGSNVGTYSRFASERRALTIGFDSDPAATELSYLEAKSGKESRLLPLLMDLTSPSPSLGWGLRERQSLIDRGPAEFVMALALIHHLAIANNVPFDHLARFLAQVSIWLVVEFVPKEDPQVQKLLAWREDVFDQYSQPSFEEAFRRYFKIHRAAAIADSPRTLYLMRKV
jgi:hypothetical protein